MYGMNYGIFEAKKKCFMFNLYALSENCFVGQRMIKNIFPKIILQVLNVFLIADKI